MALLPHTAGEPRTHKAELTVSSIAPLGPAIPPPHRQMLEISARRISPSSPRITPFPGMPGYNDAATLQRQPGLLNMPQEKGEYRRDYANEQVWRINPDLQVKCDLAENQPCTNCSSGDYTCRSVTTPAASQTGVVRVVLTLL